MSSFKRLLQDKIIVDPDQTLYSMTYDLNQHCFDKVPFLWDCKPLICIYFEVSKYNTFMSSFNRLPQDGKIGERHSV